MARTPQQPPTPQPQNVTIAPGDPIQQAIDSAPPGSTFQFQPGVWREQEFLARSGDQFIGDPGGKTVLSGARVLTEWTREGSLWRCGGLPAPLTDSDPVFDGSQANNRNDLFLDSHLLERVGSRDAVEAGKWWFDPADNSVVTGSDPSNHAMEYSVTGNQTWDNNATGCLWQNITVERYATSAQDGAHHGMKQWTYQDCTWRQMHGAGINIGAGTVVRGGKCIDNGQSGINGYAANGALVEGVEIARNGWIGYNTDWDGGGVKICGSDGVTFRGNFVHHNKDQGLWLDIDCTNCLYEGNKIEDNTGCGIMYEISYPQTRIISNTLRRNGGIGGYGGGAVYVSNSRGVEVANNTIEVKSGNKAIGGGVGIINDSRGAGNQGTYEARDITVHDNQITHENDTAQNGYWMYQPIATPNITFDRNTYIVADTSARHWRRIDADLTWDELRAAGQELNGTLQQLGDKPPDPVDPPDPIPPDPEEIPTLAPGTYKVTQGTTLIV